MLSLKYVAILLLSLVSGLTTLIGVALAFRLRNSARAQRDIPDSKKVVFKDASHLMNIDEPEEFNKLVLDFIGDL